MPCGARARGRARRRLSPLRPLPSPSPPPPGSSQPESASPSCGRQSSQGGNRLAARLRSLPGGPGPGLGESPSQTRGSRGRRQTPRGKETGGAETISLCSLVQRSLLSLVSLHLPEVRTRVLLHFQEPKFRDAGFSRLDGLQSSHLPLPPSHHGLQAPLGSLLSHSGGQKGLTQVLPLRERERKVCRRVYTQSLKNLWGGVELKGVPSWSPAAHFSRPPETRQKSRGPRKAPWLSGGRASRAWGTGTKPCVLGEQSPLLRVETSEGVPMWE